MPPPMKEGWSLGMRSRRATITPSEGRSGSLCLHCVSRETDGVGFGFFEDFVVMSHSLGGIDDDYTAVLVDAFDDVFEIG